MGYMVIVAPAAQASALDLSKNWVVECLGTEQVVDAFGSILTVPKVQFIKYDDPNPLPTWRGVKPTSGINLELVKAVQRDDINAVSALLAKGADPNSYENDGYMIPCLGYAMAKKDAVPLVRLLLRYGADVNREEPDHNKLLNYSGDASDEVVQMLIDAGADVRNKNDNRRTPLHEAAARATPTIARVLLEKGADADVNAQDYTESTPLMYAVMSRRVDTVRLLLEHGADPDAQTRGTGETPLIVAVSRCGTGNVAEQVNGCLTVKELVGKGAKQYLKDLKGRTALDYAKTLGVDSSGFQVTISAEFRPGRR